VLECDLSIDLLQAILTGCSAGGLATFIHCDDFRNLLPKSAKVKCMPDAGFFMDAYVLNDIVFDIMHIQILSVF
jgi:hypothetical protein